MGGKIAVRTDKSPVLHLYGSEGLKVEHSWKKSGPKMHGLHYFYVGEGKGEGNLI